MEYIRNKTLNDALDQEYRQYLTGHLERPQLLQNIEGDIEIGISYYKSFTADLPHVHHIATEYAYVLSGSVRFRAVDGSGAEMQFNKGDFYVFRPGEAHAIKNKAGTRILFIKAPGCNDKQVVTVDRETEEWMRSW